jgi:hypothetical protein
MMARPFDEPPPVAAHGYGPDVISLFLRLVLVAGVSLRAAPRVLQTINQALGLSLPVPCWTAGRLWLLRLGHAMLTAPRLVAEDWVWLIDHSVQIGQDKCLVILAVRAADLPEPGQSLRHEDLELIELLPAPSWTRAEVDQALEKSVERTGSVPRAIVNDHGVDLAGGVALFRQRHPQTVEVYDAKHKAACLLRARLERDPRWQAFQTRVAQTRCAVQQTELAFLTPPGPKPKARFMNLERQLAWARRVLANLREPTAVRKFTTVRRLREKFGWAAAFEADVTEWSQWQQVVDAMVALINSHGIYQGVAEVLASQLSQLDALVSSARSLGEELVQFVRSQESLVRPGERLPGSTEVLESCFGKFKQLEKQHARGGFTQLLLGFGALLADVTTEVVRHAMQASRTLDVRRWVADTLGVTVFAQRKIAYTSATESG